MDSLLSLSGVDFRYGEKPVLQQVSLGLPRGHFLGLVGPNGSGKTTLLRLAAGLLKPLSGRVMLAGRSLEEMGRAQIARQLALLPQSANLPPSFTVWELVLMGRTPYVGFLGRETPADIAAVERAIAMARCEQLADRRAEELSGGERQRVLLARALAQEPEVLLLDEPTAHLDLQHQIGVLELVSEMAREGLAVLAVFHDLNLAACYCDRLAMLSEGRLIAEGAPEKVLTRELLGRLFQVDLCLTQHPAGPIPAVLPAGPRRVSSGNGAVKRGQL
jgi:iron complex transport system ATP-binding protein